MIGNVVCGSRVSTTTPIEEERGSYVIRFGDKVNINKGEVVTTMKVNNKNENKD